MGSTSWPPATHAWLGGQVNEPSLLLFFCTHKDDGWVAGRCPDHQSSLPLCQYIFPYTFAYIFFNYRLFAYSSHNKFVSICTAPFIHVLRLLAPSFFSLYFTIFSYLILVQVLFSIALCLFHKKLSLCIVL